jgi:hypothetical protein
MALHGRLVQEREAATGEAQPGAPRRGFLAGLRSVRLTADGWHRTGRH